MHPGRQNNFSVRIRNVLSDADDGTGNRPVQNKLKLGSISVLVWVYAIFTLSYPFTGCEVSIDPHIPEPRTLWWSEKPVTPENRCANACVGLRLQRVPLQLSFSGL